MRLWLGPIYLKYNLIKKTNIFNNLSNYEIICKVVLLSHYYMRSVKNIIIGAKKPVDRTFNEKANLPGNIPFPVS